MSPGTIPKGGVWQARADKRSNNTAEGDALAELSNSLNGLTLKERKLNGEIRTCKWCNVIKADRSHHCSKCQRCVLRMDHHCPWINNCVGHNNIKFFYLAILYGLVLCLFISLTSVDTLSFYASTVEPTQIEDPNGDGGLWVRNPWLSKIWIFSSTMCLVVCLGGLLSFYVVFVTVNILRNQTTLEFCEKNTKERRQRAVDANSRPIDWNLGWYRNLQQVLGPHVITWFLPLDYGRGDGLSFPTQRDYIDDEERSDLLN